MTDGRRNSTDQRIQPRNASTTQPGRAAVAATMTPELISHMQAHALEFQAWIVSQVAKRAAEIMGSHYAAA